MPKFPVSPDTYLAITYMPNKAAAFVLGAIFYAFGALLLIQAAAAKRPNQNILASLISGILGSALIVRGVFAGNPTITTWTVTNILNEVGASSMTGLHFGLLSRLLREIPNAPSASKRIAMRVGSLAVAVVFGVLAGAGYAVLRSDASPDQVKTAESIVKAGVGGQFTISVLFLSVLYHYETTSDGLRRYKSWKFAIQTSALLVFGRNLAHLITTVFTSNNLTRESEAAAYCTDTLFTLLVIMLWAVANLPRLCRTSTSAEKPTVAG